jgi:hypothetical protein
MTTEQLNADVETMLCADWQDNKETAAERLRAAIAQRDELIKECVWCAEQLGVLTDYAKEYRPEHLYELLDRCGEKEGE